MELIKILCTSIGSVISLFLMAKLIGHKQISQLNMFDYINGITIGSIGAELATTSEKDFWKPLTGLLIYGLATYIINLVSSKSIKLRRFLEGRSVILYEKGKLYPENFKKAKLDLNEFLTMCRVGGFFDLSEINTAIFEPNGRISFLPAEQKRPITPEDINVYPQQSQLKKCIIIDGKILSDNLRHTGRDENFLKARLKEKNLSLSDVFLGVGDNNGNFDFYSYEMAKNNDDPFQ